MQPTGIEPALKASEAFVLSVRLRLLNAISGDITKLLRITLSYTTTCSGSCPEIFSKHFYKFFPDTPHLLCPSSCRALKNGNPAGFSVIIVNIVRQRLLPVPHLPIRRLHHPIQFFSGFPPALRQQDHSVHARRKNITVSPHFLRK